MFYHCGFQQLLLVTITWKSLLHRLDLVIQFLMLCQFIESIQRGLGLTC